MHASLVVVLADDMGQPISLQCSCHRSSHDPCDAGSAPPVRNIQHTLAYPPAPYTPGSLFQKRTLTLHAAPTNGRASWRTPCARLLSRPTRSTGSLRARSNGGARSLQSVWRPRQWLWRLMRRGQRLPSVMPWQQRWGLGVVGGGGGGGGGGCCAEPHCAHSTAVSMTVPCVSYLFAACQHAFHHES